MSTRRTGPPEGENGIIEANRFSDAFTFPRTEGVRGYHDITPRMGAAYDVFGNGKTAVKVNISKYLQSAMPARPTPSAIPE